MPCRVGPVYAKPEPEVYRELYKAFVQVFRDACAAATDWPAPLDLERTSLNAFAIVDALVRHALLVHVVALG